MDNQNPFSTTPEQPSVPVQPEAPAVPEQSAAPEAPVVTPVPEQPVTPDAPPMPETPVYGAPAQPVQPAPEQPFMQTPPPYDPSGYQQQQPGYMPPQQPYYGQQPGYIPQEPNKGKAIAALVLGIASLVIAWFGYGALISLLCGIVGIVLAIQARKEMPAGTTSMATAGLVLSIIGTALSAIMFIFVCLACTALGSLAYL